MLILGLDASLNRTGWGIIEVLDGQVSLFDKGLITTKGSDHARKLKYLRDEICKIFNKYPVDVAIREAGFNKYPKATHALFKAYGVVEEVTAEFDTKCMFYAPSAIKKTITGNGKANKALVEKYCRILLNLTSDIQFESDDVSDAVGIALTYVIKFRNQLGIGELWGQTKINK